MDNIELNVEAFWERLKEISKTQNKTQVTFCKELGFDLQQFRNKKFIGSFPTLEQLVKLSNYFGVSLNYLITGSSTSEAENNLQAELDAYKDKFKKLSDIINEPVSSHS